MMTPELYFFRFAWPCTESRYQRGLIKEKQYLALKDCAESTRVPSRELLESVYTDAIGNMEKHFGSRKSIWSIHNIKDYFYRLHEVDLEKKYAHKARAAVDHCKVRIGVVEKVNKTTDRDLVSVTIDGNIQGAINTFHIPISDGEKVSVHLGHIVEKLSK